MVIPGSWFRIVSKRRTRRQVLPSQRGRFHDDPQAEPTSYVADSILTAWLEVTAHIGIAPANPEAFRAWQLDLSAVALVDLRSARKQSRWQIGSVELLADPAAVRCKEIARAIRIERNCLGLVYESVRNRPQGICAVLFLENFRKVPECELVPDTRWKDFISEVSSE